MASAILVLGGNGDIGKAICKRFAGAGYEVIPTGRADMDLGQPDAIDQWFSRSRSTISTLVHCAGISHPKGFEDLTQEEIEESFEVNINGFLRVLRHALPDLAKEQGRIVIISSLYGFLARVGRLPYVMSKHALIGAVKTLSLELAEKGILVNAVSPGYIDTKMTSANNTPETIAKLVSFVPLKKLGTPEDVAEGVYFLGSSHNRYITGQNLIIDGGFSVDGGRN